MRTLVFHLNKNDFLKNKILNILTNAKSFGFGTVRLVIKEVVLKPGIKEAISIIKEGNYLLELNVPVFFKLEPEFEFLKKQNLANIIFEFSDPNTPLSIIRKFIERRKILSAAGIKLGIKCILSHQNAPQILDLIKIIKEIKPDFIKFQEISPPEPNNLMVDFEDLKYYSPMVKRHLNYFAVEVESNYQEDNFYNFIKGEEVVIEPDGLIRLFPFSKMPALGNIFKENFKKILNKLDKEYNLLVKETCQDGEFLNWSWYFKRYFPKHFNIKYSTKAPSPFIKHIFLEPTNKCDLNCKFCFKRGNEYSLNFNKLHSLIAENNKLRFPITSFDFGGRGNPLLYKNIRNILETLCQNNKRISIITNGLNLKKEISTIDYAILKNIDFCIYLDSPNSKKNNFLMGRNVFAKTLDAIEFLLSRNLRYSIFMRITPLNYNEIEEMMRLGRHYCCNSLVPIDAFFYSGGNDKFLLNEEMRVSVINTIDWLRSAGEPIFKNIHFESSEAVCSYLRKERLFINSRGQVAFCHFLPNQEEAKNEIISEGGLASAIEKNNDLRNNFLEERERRLKTKNQGRFFPSPCSYCFNCFAKSKGIEKMYG